VSGSADQADARPLPLTADGVTAAWLSAALRTRYPAVTVAAADRLEVIEGTATKVLVALRYDGDADGLPDRVWIKGGFGDHREFTGNLGVYHAEVQFFTDIAPRYGLHHPRSYFALAQDSKVEVAQAQTQLEQTQAQDIDVGVARAQYQHAIAVLIGKPPESFSLPPMPLTENPPIVPVGLPSQLLERRPDIAAAERQMAAANEQIGIAKSAFFPDLLISATGGLQSGSIVDWFTWPSRYWSVGTQMVQTIFDAGRRRAQVESALASYDSTVANYRQTALTAFQEVEDNLSTLRILEQESAKQHEATRSAENSLELSMNRYKGGLVTYLEVITAQSIALTNERTDVDLLRRRMDASVLLIKALGGGWDVSKLPQT
jgi:NodT family efflux transporter outer membrane factor (OMF) lipoprotein